jgi:DNA invertase Pin-like site-specific DNA recombinase
MVFGYTRISKPKQNIERQVRNIQAFSSDAVIVREVFTGTRFQGRAELDKLLKTVKPDDTIIFDSVSRMSRNADEGFMLYEELFNKGINLVFLKERHIDTATYKQARENIVKADVKSGDDDTDDLINGIFESVNRYIMRLARKQIQLAFAQAEKEVEDLHQRTREGIVTARLNGKQIGQQKGKKLTTKKSIAAKAKIKKYNNTFGGTLNNEETITQVGISRMTFYKYKAELVAEMNGEQA